MRLTRVDLFVEVGSGSFDSSLLTLRQATRKHDSLFLEYLSSTLRDGGVTEDVRCLVHQQFNTHSEGLFH